jgi:hypothetical protein
MRESTGYSKNNLTGVVNEVTKMKPANSRAKGIHTIQLVRESDGKVVQEIESENFISATWEDVQKGFAELAMLGTEIYDDTGMQGIRHNSALLTNQNNYENFFGHPKVTGFLPWTTMLLTNNKELERPLTERAVFGEVVGYADRETSYSGASTTLGSFNSAESFKNAVAKQLHFVWDFPTHASNGEFQSLYWNPDVTYNRIGFLPINRTTVTLPTGYEMHTDVRGAKLKGNKYYIATKRVSDNKRGIAVYDVDWATRQLTPATIPVIFLNTTVRINDFDLDNAGDIYISDQDLSGRITRYNPATGELKALSNLAMFFNPVGQYNASWERLLNIDANNTMFVTMQSNSAGNDLGGNGSGVIAYDLATMTKNKTPKIFDIDIVDVFYIYSEDYKSILYYCDGVVGTVATDNQNLTVTQKNGPMKMPYEYVGGSTLWKRPTIIKNALGEPEHISFRQLSTTSVRVEFNHVGRIGGRNLLPAPVVKTNEFTMKITYDLFFE